MTADPVVDPADWTGVVDPADWTEVAETGLAVEAAGGAGGGTTTILMLWLAVPLAFVATRLIGNDPLSVGVPMIDSVVSPAPPPETSDSPVGRVPASDTVGAGRPPTDSCTDPATPSVNSASLPETSWELGLSVRFGAAG
jgi:hypothetical protein